MNPLTQQLADDLRRAFEAADINNEGWDDPAVLLEICDDALQAVTARHRRESDEFERFKHTTNAQLKANQVKMAEQASVIQAQMDIVNASREKLGAMRRELVKVYDTGAVWYKSLGQTIQGIK